MEMPVPSTTLAARMRIVGFCADSATEVAQIAIMTVAFIRMRRMMIPGLDLTLKHTVDPRCYSLRIEIEPNMRLDQVVLETDRPAPQAKIRSNPIEGRCGQGRNNESNGLSY